MKKALIIVVGMIIIMWSCVHSGSTSENGSSNIDSAKTASLKNDPFPDFGFMDPNYKGTVFKLSQNYPETLPNEPLPDFFKTNFKTDWRKYLLQVQQYCFDGNTGVDFRVENNTVRRWYHMPWQHYGKNGREGFHGLTQEAPIKKFQLAFTQTIDTSGAVAVGFYNDIAGYTIGQVWKNHDKPDTSHNISFKNGAVLFKLLFVTLPQQNISQQVPWLVNGIWWDAYPATNFKKPTIRHKTKVVLVQMDIMVRDDHAPNGWIFGNFQYNGNLKRADKWQNLIPVGIMWGQDHDITTNASNPTPLKTIINSNLKETIINSNTDELPATHLGWNSRLNGPLDNPMSSCYSCHSTAQYQALSILNPTFDSVFYKKNPAGSPVWMRWFANLKCGVPFDKEAKSMDFSLQLSGSLQNFYDWKTNEGGLFASAYKATPSSVMMESHNLMEPSSAVKNVSLVKKKKVYPIAFPVPK